MILFFDFGVGDWKGLQMGYFYVGHSILFQFLIFSHFLSFSVSLTLPSIGVALHRWGNIAQKI
jgi:hypothetical protein